MVVGPGGASLPAADEVPPAVAAAARLAAVRATGLLDTAPEAAFDELAELAAAVADAPYAFVTIVDERRSYWKSVIGLGDLPVEQRQGPVVDSFCKYLIATGGPLLVSDVAADARVRDNAAVAALGIGAWAGHPLHSPDGQVLGSFCVIDTKARQWTPRQVQTLATLARAVGGEIALREALRQATELARALQQNLLPPELPEVPGVGAAAAYISAGGTEVIGDFYDLFAARPGWWCAVLGDVSGKGADAARLTALARYTIRAEATQAQRPTPSMVLGRLNQGLLTQQGESPRFLSAVQLSFSVVPGELHGRLCTAGHPPVLVRRAGGAVEEISTKGLPLGMTPDARLRDVTLSLGPGETAVLYTDGITEARPDRTGAVFGIPRLRDLLAGAGGLDAQGILDRIVAAVAAHAEAPARDDTAVLVLQVRPVAAATE